MNDAALSALEELRAAGKASVIVSCESKVIGIVALSDTLRLEGAAMVKELEEMGTKAVLLTGDNRKAAEYFAGHAIPWERCDAICSEIHAQTLNLVLIGMPGCGKSSIGRRAARLLGKPFIDCDAEIERRAGMPIPEMFNQYGEDAFRALETEVISDLCRSSGQVIATGGGAILRPENVRAMRQNGRICFLRRSIDRLPRNGRPLSSSADRVRQLWEERKHLYNAAADFIVENEAPVPVVAEKLKEAFYEAAHH